MEAGCVLHDHEDMLTGPDGLPRVSLSEFDSARHYFSFLKLHNHYNPVEHDFLKIKRRLLYFPQSKKEYNPRFRLNQIS